MTRDYATRSEKGLPMRWKRRDARPALRLIRSGYSVVEWPKDPEKDNEFTMLVNGRKFVIKEYEGKLKVFYPSDVEVSKL